MMTSALGQQHETPRATAVHHTRKYAFIDALRGYAVLLVILSHTGGIFSQLPYPVKKLTNFGFHGVQLFFLMSCVTLLMSWQSDRAKGQLSLSGFWIRRLFRIAPMYYLAGLFYFYVEPPSSGFSLTQLLATLAFVNVWHPLLVPTVLNHWQVVPGGWSIGVEFTFYAVFPLIATAIRSMRAAAIFCVTATVAGCLANPWVEYGLASSQTPLSISEFVYFWFPNQLPVFALGTVMYFVLDRLRASPDGPPGRFLRMAATPIILASIATCIIVASLPFPEVLPFSGPLILPKFLAASLIFMVAVAAMASDMNSPFVNRPICALGQVSFSAYLLHFVVLHKLAAWLPKVFDVAATGWHAIFTCMFLFPIVVVITFGLSAITFRWVERPMMQAGRHLLARRDARRATIAIGNSTSG